MKLIELLHAEKKNAFYYKGLNMFAVKQLASKVKSNSASISVIAILLFLSITSMAFGLGGGKSINQGQSTHSAVVLKALFSQL